MSRTTAALAATLLVALRRVPGLRPATPATVPAASWVPWDYDTLAIDIDPDVVEVRVVVTRLPLPPLLRHAETVLRTSLQDTAWAQARLRIVVAGIDRVALDTAPSPTGESSRHTVASQSGRDVCSSPVSTQ